MVTCVFISKLQYGVETERRPLVNNFLTFVLVFNFCRTCKGNFDCISLKFTH